MQYNNEKEFWDKADKRAKETGKIVVREEMETELYAVFVDGNLVEKGSRQVPVEEKDNVR